MNTNSKNVIITGATGAIGGDIAGKIADKKEYSVILVCRNEESKAVLHDRFIRIDNRNNIRLEVADLSRKTDIINLAVRIQEPVHVLINNAATAPVHRETTPDGLEMQFATNIMNYFWMTLAFLPHLKKADSARIVNVASYWAGDLDLDDLQFVKRKYNNNTAYRQSKQGNRMLSTYFASLFKEYKITVNACHPGEVGSKLSYNLGFAGSESPSKGSETPVWLATEDIGGTVSGKWFEYMNECPCRFSSDREGMKRLFNICMEYSKGINL